MAKKTKTEEAYADLVIQSLVQDDYLVGKPKETDAMQEVMQERKKEISPQRETEEVVTMEKEKPPRKEKVSSSVGKSHIARRGYEETFVRESDITARKGKQVSIRGSYHDRIMKLIHVIGKNEVSIASYIDNVLAAHFEDYQDDIAESFERHIKAFTNF